jgi:hypothetical protein
VLSAPGNVPPGTVGLLPASALFFEEPQPNQAALLSPPRDTLQVVRLLFKR